ncbi:hypothetical protein, partial [Dyadobacter frigoris]|uniref:hypothetical protein n=1 Tax=Dyadobacter frigoris TaxID=2576211 RepID=UPI0025542B7B
SPGLVNWVGTYFVFRFYVGMKLMAKAWLVPGPGGPRLKPWVSELGGNLFCFSFLRRDEIDG